MSDAPERAAGRIITAEVLYHVPFAAYARARGCRSSPRTAAAERKEPTVGFNYLEEDEKKREARKEVGCFCCGEGGRKISRSAWIR
jgi:hypothetical protein